MTAVASDTADPSRTYRQPIDDVIAALGTNVQRGLSNSEAQSRLQQHGRNELVAETPLPAWRRLLAQFQDVLVILLLVATAISAGLWAYEGDAELPYEAIAIFAVVVLNATMGYIQESRAKAAVAGSTGLEPAASGVTGRRANQLNYDPISPLSPRRPNDLPSSLNYLMWDFGHAR